MNELIKIENGTAILDPETSYQIAHFERLMKSAKQREDGLKARILEEMKAHNIKKIETEDITITYVPESERETFDSKRFRSENPDTYDDYVKFSTVKPSVRVKVK